MNIEGVLAPNPSLFTGPGTNTYVISSAGKAVVLDPGPIIDSHIAGIDRAVGNMDLLAVMVPHTHADHAPAANVLGSAWNVEVLGYGPGPDFEPTVTVADGEHIDVGDIVMEILHTPGHTDDHVCYRIADVIFTGDHIMSGSTVLIEDATAYMKSLRRVADLTPDSLYPGHGPNITDASAAITSYIEHRLAREREIVAAVDRGAGTISEIVAVVYSEVDPRLQAAAAQQVAVQLTKLEGDGKVQLTRPVSGDGPMVRRAEEPPG